MAHTGVTNTAHTQHSRRSITYYFYYYYYYLIMARIKAGLFFTELLHIRLVSKSKLVGSVRAELVTDRTP